MKRILYIGPFRESSGAGNSCRNYISALHKAGHDVCVSSIYNTADIYPVEDIDSEILPLETNYLKSYDIVIQHCHPSEYTYDYRFQNIGIFQFNSYPVDFFTTDSLKLLDNIVVNSMFNYTALCQKIDRKLQSKIRYVPELIDIAAVSAQDTVKYQWIQDHEFVFYAIGDLIDRKNFFKIITAYTELFYDDPTTSLIIKTKPHFRHRSEQEVRQEIDYIYSKCYSVLRINSPEKRREPKIMSGLFDKNAIISLHKNGDCFIDASMGENFGYSVLEASVLNNKIITNKNSSSAEINPNSLLIDSHPVQVMDGYHDNLLQNRTDSTWYDINYANLKEKMLTARYESYVTQTDLSRFSYDKAGELLC